MSRKKNVHNTCESVVEDGEQRMLLREQGVEKESLEVSCVRGQTVWWNAWSIQESWPTVGDQTAGCQELGGQPHLNLKAREPRNRVSQSHRRRVPVWTGG